MKIEGIIWLDEITEKIAYKHSVQRHEVREVLFSKPCFRFAEKGHRRGENVYSAMGRTKGGRYLIVFFVYKSNKQALILSAREMTSSERKRYEKK